MIITNHQLTNRQTEALVQAFGFCSTLYCQPPGGMVLFIVVLRLPHTLMKSHACKHPRFAKQMQRHAMPFCARMLWLVRAAGVMVNALLKLLQRHAMPFCAHMLWLVRAAGVMVGVSSGELPVKTDAVISNVNADGNILYYALRFRPKITAKSWGKEVFMSINIARLHSEAEKLNCFLNENQLKLLSDYADAVLDANKCFNLTAITDETDFLNKHLLDSLAAAPLIAEKARVCDLGSGAGFPAAVLAIARPDIEMTALDSTSKKMAFVAQTAKALGISNLKAVAGRAEEQRAMFSSFDCVTARAVASLPVLLELGLPLLKKGGTFIAYKSDEGELASSRNALAVLGGRLGNSISFKLPNGDNRVLISIEKSHPTPPSYPRVYGAIKKKPL
jgi:16S rRNA (guanine527-N7)-methyltransferase